MSDAQDVIDFLRSVCGDDQAYIAKLEQEVRDRSIRLESFKVQNAQLAKDVKKNWRQLQDAQQELRTIKNQERNPYG